MPFTGTQKANEIQFFSANPNKDADAILKPLWDEGMLGVPALVERLVGNYHEYLNKTWKV